jgi:hypothetical protein
MIVICGKTSCFDHCLILKSINTMKKTIIKYGLISGAIATICIFIMTLVLKSYGFDNTATVGFSLIILSMSVIFFGIKAFRDNENEGHITFMNGLLIGLGIAVISTVCYSLAWMVVYYNFMPNFMEDYAKFSIDKLKTSGASEAELSKNQAELQQLKDIYKSPFGVFAITLIEPLPIGIVGALVSAFILKKK